MLVCNTLVTVNLNVAIIPMVRPIQDQAQTDVNYTKNVICPNTTFLWGKNNEEENSTVHLPQVNKALLGNKVFVNLFYSQERILQLCSLL